MITLDHEEKGTPLQFRGHVSTRARIEQTVQGINVCVVDVMLNRNKHYKVVLWSDHQLDFLMKNLWLGRMVVVGGYTYGSDETLFAQDLGIGPY